MKPTLEEFLANHPEIEEFYVISQPFFNPFTGSKIERQNAVNVNTWKSFCSYEFFRHGKVQNVTYNPNPAFQYESVTIRVKVPKSVIKKEITRLFF